MVKNNLKTIEARFEKAKRELKQKEQAYKKAKMKLFAEYGELKFQELELQNPGEEYNIEELIRIQKQQNKKLEKEIEEENELAKLELEDD
ncbi:hypothetical protein [Ligilactobacillus salivarius]|uniref:hypothetical protein n=1 Tax=Ligilactobacillus salivarius TaxID=1624 RepID=UPI0005C5A8C1|nr:hypothetical protein [Ligilactobacillus salivarius]MDH4960351.1 hypothetical protein [Ligilactobacillus salivarius]UUY24348.1 hypothetical protein NUU06_10155 [Ligilactobacillus salivarius]